MQSPFDNSGITRGPDGIQRYDDLPDSLVEMLRNSAQEWPDAIAIAEPGGDPLTYTQLWDRASRVAGGLREQGVGKGDRVAVKMPNGVAWVLGFLGTILAGGIAVPVNTRFTATESDYVTGDSGAKVVLDSAELPDGPAYADETLTHADLCALFYTSGTTGFPKGARTTHGNLLGIVETTRRIRDLNKDSRGLRNLISVPLFHVTGCNSQLLSMLYVGAAAIIMPAFNIDLFLQALQDEKITMSTSVPAIYWLALNSPKFKDFDLSHLERVSYGGAPIAPELIARLREAIPQATLGNGYGLSEGGSVVTYLPDEWTDSRPESVGFAIPIDDLRIDGEGTGELMIRGQNVVDGYWQQPEATAAAFQDGWLRTGDIASIDENGFVTVFDRLKDMVCRGGENVYSIEVESALTAYPEAAEVSIIGVPDEVMGERVGAVVVPAPGFEMASFIAFAREHLADFKVPEWISMRDTPLPRNPGGKVLKAQVREAADWERVPRAAR